MEIMVAGGLFALVTAAAMISYVSLVQLTNTQQQTSNATDAAREALRMIANDVRAAAPGMSQALLAGGASNVCPQGTIPYSNGTLGSLACLPPVFRSSVPTFAYTQVNGAALNNNCGALVTSPGFQLSYVGAGGVPAIEPTAANFFCPDDLVIVAVDDADSFFITGLPANSLAATPVQFLFMPPPAGTDLVGQTSLDELGSQALVTNPMVLISGAGGPVLMNSGAVGACGANYTNTSYGCSTVTLGPTGFDLFGSVGAGTPVAMPARLVQYSIQPVVADGAAPGTAFVSGNLVRAEVTPSGTTSANPFQAAPVMSTLVNGVIDMQVEFGLDPLGTGQLRYVNSGGYQAAYTVAGGQATPEAPANHLSTNCNGGFMPAGLFWGTCFPSNELQFLRSVRINLLVREGSVNNSRNGARTAAGVAAPFYIQPAVQDLTNGNVEAQSWGYNGATLPGFPTIDGASYREISTEVFVRNLGISNNF